MKFKFFTVIKGKEEYIHIKAKTKEEALNIMKIKYPENKVRQIIIEDGDKKPSFLSNLNSAQIKRMTLIPLVITVIGFAIFFYPKIGILINTEDIHDNKSVPYVVEEEVSEETAQQSVVEEEVVEETAQQKILENIKDLVASGKAFDPGTYKKGDIPKGEYAFIPFSGKYYSEEDASGNIIDNENFDSFGYVFVHAVGNIKSDGFLINEEAFEVLGVSCAKELYEVINNVESYKDSAYYKVGLDIPLGHYVIESYGKGYVAVMNGPIGNSDIVENENFNGEYSVNVIDNQYLKVSNGTISKVDAENSVEDISGSNESDTSSENENSEAESNESESGSLSNNSEVTVITFPEDSLENLINQSNKDQIEKLHIENGADFSLEGIGELTNLKEIYISDTQIITYFKAILELKKLENIIIGNKDGDTSNEMFLRQWGLSNDVNYIYPDGTQNYWSSGN